MSSTETALQVASAALPTDDHLIELWLHERSPHTQRAYRADVEQFRVRAGKPLQAVTLADLQDFANSMTGCSAASRYRTLSAVKSLLAFGHRLGYLLFDVGRHCDSPRSATGSTNAFSPKLTCTDPRSRAEPAQPGNPHAALCFRGPGQ